MSKKKFRKNNGGYIIVQLSELIPSSATFSTSGSNIVISDTSTVFFNNIAELYKKGKVILFTTEPENIGDSTQYFRFDSIGEATIGLSSDGRYHVNISPVTATFKLSGGSENTAGRYGYLTVGSTSTVCQF